MFMVKTEDRKLFLEAFGKSDIGLVRSNNEDSYLVDAEKGIYIVCDGVGGEKAGEIASKTAIRETVKYLEEEWDYLDECRRGNFKDDAIFRFAADAVRHACKKVNELSKENPHCHSMATTLTMAIEMGARILICHVGDSRAYLKNENGVHQISEDHTLAKEFIKKGLMKTSEEESSPLKNVLTRTVGTYPSVEVDCVMVPVAVGDKLILCSDGVSNYFYEEDSLDSLIDNRAVKEDVEELINFALKNKGEDNATAIVLKVVEGSSASDQDFLQEVLISDVLTSFAVFEDLSFSSIARMRSHMEVVHLKKDEVLIQACEKFNGFYIVLEGGVLSGEELLIRGESIGLKSIVKDSYSPDTKIAVRDTRLLFFSKRKFDSFSKRYPRIVNEILRNIIEHI